MFERKRKVVSIDMRLPESYKVRMKDILKEEFDAYIQSLDEERYYGIRYNDIKIDANTFESLIPVNLDSVPWAINGYYYDKAVHIAKHPYYHAGLYYIQEPSAMVPAAVMPISKGDKVLDLCAAPGGKSTHLGAKLHNTGILVCNDISVSRAKGLLKNIEMFGITNAIVMSESPKKLESYFEDFFDKILIDAPCSGEGMFRKEPSMIKSWETKGVEYYVNIQKDILSSAAKMMKPGGYMVYSTCTFALEENEEMMTWFVNQFPEFELIHIHKVNGFEPGLTLTEPVRLWPHKLKGEGHFVALLHKKEDDHFINGIKNNKLKAISEKLIKDYIQFEKEILNIKLDRDRLMLNNNKLYYMPKGLPDLSGLRLLRTGWYLGELKKNRFEPSQAFASGLKPSQVKKVIKLSIEDHNVIRYLKGESIEVEADKGYCLVCVEDYPLGWAKKDNSNSLLKNKYQPGWRWM